MAKSIRVLRAVQEGGVYSLSWYIPNNKTAWSSVLSAVKMIPERSFDSVSKKWSCPVNQRTTQLLTTIGFKIKQCKVVEEKREKVTPVIDESYKDVVLKNVTSKARDYQIDGIKQMVHWDCNILQAYDMGLGKSLMTISSLNHLDKYPVLIVCPATLKINWQREIELWGYKNKDTYIVEGTTVKEDYKDYSYIIINYDILWFHLEYILKEVRPVAVTFDECHVLKSGGSYISKYYPDYNLKKNEHIVTTNTGRQVWTLPPKRVRASQWLVNGLSPELEARLGAKWEGVKHTMLLTGTPIQNNNSDLFNLLQLLNPKQFTDRLKFTDYFCLTESGYKQGSIKIVGSKNNDILHKILLEKYMIRKLKDDVLTELPPLTKTVIPIPLDPSYRKEYDSIDEDFKEWVQNNEGSNLSQEQERKARNTRFRALLDTARDGKLENCFKYVDNIIDNSNAKVILFSYHRKIIQAISKRYGKKCVELYGGTSLKDRQESVDRFQTDPKIQIFNGQLNSASVGITLTASSTVIFIETGFLSHYVQQACDRSRRLGNTSDKIQAIFLQAESTLEQIILTKLDKKQTNMEAVVDGKDTEEDDMLSYLYKEYLKKT